MTEYKHGRLGQKNAAGCGRGVCRIRVCRGRDVDGGWSSDTKMTGSAFVGSAGPATSSPVSGRTQKERALMNNRAVTAAVRKASHAVRMDARNAPAPGASAMLSGLQLDTQKSLMDSVHKRTDDCRKEPISIVVLGASGDLAKKKTFPALFSLFYHDLLPDDFQIVGYARRDMSDDEFRELILGSLTCRVLDGRKCSEKMDQFLPRCRYHKGSYASEEDMASLDKLTADFEEQRGVSNRLFYLAVPPSVFEDACHSIHRAARGAKGWTRVIVEKPFGRDLASYVHLQASLSSSFSEEEVYRIDHYLGKELVQNLMTLRFANSIFEPLWNHHHIESVQISFKEPFGVEGRAGYFNDFGIVRDIMQNHLLQALALLAMETPVSLSGEDIRNEKVKVLRQVKPLTIDDFVLGQYKAANGKPGYFDDDGVPKNSTTPTFASCVFHIPNRRWEGVPFLMRAGKALDERKAEIVIQFKPAPGDIFNVPESMKSNCLVIRVQPDEAIYMKIISKAPGLTSRLEQARLNLFYREAWEESKDIPDAYERLILDAIQGEKSLFIRDDELRVAWQIFDTALKQMEGDRAPKPAAYNYGSAGPIEAERQAFKLGLQWIHD
ncbi:Glucose-6-phosphate 1-dehydrogenase 2, chloroplastic [Porphyridium purpureum]|uniref:Glucose-6-phosphate 1-dehydrogenase n=1 Tax=Porphyridium purpureum TaxID=35688 RepID=A0A5J4YY36_PORPP|nr:Glucose-6-phosphate 1-dehydrogenase 2, chloroplastic [Porphyridium purpureum]|eukprot:POR1668..scf209_3